MLSVLVPEMECSVASSSAKSAMLGVERNIVDRVNLCRIRRWRIAVALEGEIGTESDMLAYKI